MNPLKVLWQAARALYEELYRFFLMGCVTVLALGLILPGPFAMAGLWGVAQRVAETGVCGWNDYWDSLKRYGPRNFKNAVIALIIYGLLGMNFWFYNTPGVTPVSKDIALVATSFWIGMTVLWTATLYYWLSFQFAMTEPRLWLSLRNSLFLVLARPFQTAVFLIAAGLSTALCVVFPPLAALLPGFTALVSIIGLRELLPPLIKPRDQNRPATTD